jgi:hypothetical protein
MLSGPTLSEDREERLDSVASFSHQLDAAQLEREEMPRQDVGELVKANEGQKRREER